ncbi:MAG: nucleotide exchange factor GrpE [Mycoplasmataceae bacterium]|jgi:molecular chaperone GrpE|nr:nucleotide exchange factor GrpE [Mycoplasmataceae bacterium]
MGKTKEVNPTEETVNNQAEQTANAEPAPTQATKKVVKEADPITQLTEKNKKLELDLILQKTKSANLELQLQQLNNDYAQKINEKVRQANEIVATKLAELEAKHSKELTEAKKYQLTNLAKQLADIIDQFSLAVNYPIADEKIRNYQNGFKMFCSMFNNLLADLNVSIIPIKIGDQFNENYMSVVETVEDPKLPNNAVCAVISNAYKMADRVIKIANVKVVKND